MGMLLGISRFLLSFRKNKSLGVPVCTENLLFYSDKMDIVVDDNGIQYIKNMFIPPIPPVVKEYISWTLNFLGWLGSESIDSVGDENRPFISGTYILAELGTVFNIAGLLSTDLVYPIDLNGIGAITVIDSQIQLTEGESYGGFKIERNGTVIGVFPVIEGKGTVIFNQITDGVLGNVFIAGSAIDLWQTSAFYSNTANDLGHSVADGSTMYSDKLGASLIPVNTIIPVDINNTEKVCAYNISGVQLDATYTGVEKINLVASTPTYINYATDNIININTSDFTSLINTTLTNFKWETTCKLTSNSYNGQLLYLDTDDVLGNEIILFDDFTDGITGTYLGNTIKSTDFGSVVHFPVNIKFTAFLNFSNGILNIGYHISNITIELFSQAITANNISSFGISANAITFKTLNIGDIFYNSKITLNGTLISEYVNFGTIETINLEKVTVSNVSGTTTNLKTYVQDGETYHYRNGFKVWTKPGESDIPAILNNNGADIFDYSGSGYEVNETISSGFTGIYSLIDTMYSYEQSQAVNYQIPEIYTSGEADLLSYSDIKAIDNASVLLTETGNNIADLKVYDRTNEAVPISDGYMVGITKTDCFVKIGCDPRIDEVLNQDITYFSFETLCTFSNGVLMQMSDSANGQTQTITIQITSNIVSLYREIDDVQYNNVDIVLPYTANDLVEDNDYSNSVRIKALSLDGLNFSLSIEFFKTGELFIANGSYSTIYNHTQLSFKLGKGNNNGSRTVAGVAYVKLDLNQHNYYYVFRYDFYSLELYTGRVERFDFNTSSTKEQLSIPDTYIDGIYKNGYKLWYNSILNDYRKSFKLENGNDNANYTGAGYVVVLDVGAGDTTMYSESIDFMGLVLGKNDAKSKLLDTQNLFIDSLGETKALTYAELDAIDVDYFASEKAVVGQISGAKLTGTYSLVPNYDMPYSAPYYALDIVDDLSWKTDTLRLLHNQDGTAKQYLYSELTALQGISYIDITLNGDGNPVTFKLKV